MSMLAEPKKKKRYNLVPRGKALYTDENRFGTKMLKKMGWSEGNGLGANADGSTDFVRVRYKNDIEGLGYEDRDDQWTQHESEFSGLLKKLNNENDSDSETEGTGAVGLGFQTSNIIGNEKSKLKDKVSGESLEEKSKQSRARVHYKKFTRGKDLSRYSEKELANIFGKKVIDIDDVAENGVVDTKEVDFTEASEKEMPANFAGVQTYSSSLSVGEYFKQKMQALKNKLWKGPGFSPEEATPESVPEEKSSTNNDTNVVNEIEQKKTAKKKKGKKRRAEGTETFDEVASLKQENERIADVSENIANDSEIVHETVSEIKLKKNKHLEEVREELAAAISEADNDLVMKKKKKLKKAEIEISLNTPKKEENELNTLKEKENASRKRKRCDYSSQKELLSPADNEKDEDSTEVKRKTNASSIKTEPSCFLNIEAIEKQYDESKKYTISKFTAEKFSNFDFSGFKGSNLNTIDGYGMDDIADVNIVEMPNDDDRIINFWDETLDKYKYATPKYEFNKFVGKVRVAYKTKGRVPKFNVKSLKRKSAFVE